jgi:hypothetical protein
LPSRKFRLNSRNRAARPQSMRGCTCHFTIKRTHARRSVALIIYHERRHINKSGFVCHGPLDRDAIGPGASKVPYVGSEIRQQTMSLIYLGVPEEYILQTHIEGIRRYSGSDARANSIASQYVHKLGMIIKRSTHELDLDDQASVRMWADRNKKSVFFHQDATETDAFVLGIQTEWQLRQMIRFGHRSILASHSSFGVSKLKVSSDHTTKVDTCLCGYTFIKQHFILHVSIDISRSRFHHLFDTLRTPFCSTRCTQFLYSIQDSKLCLLRGL